VLAFYGAWYGRRFTAWIWATAIALGTFTIVGKEIPNNNTRAGVVFLICGVVLVGLGWLLAYVLDEEDDDEAEPELTPAH
jgi:drug/metabolite transporter (DMT)-like permease